MAPSVMREWRGPGPRIMLAAGLIAASGFALVSIAANLRFGISLATTTFDRIVYGTLSIAVDLIKITLPLAVALLWRNGERIFAVLGAIFWTGAVAFSICAAIGFAASTRNHMLGAGQQEIDKRQAWRAKIVRLEGSLDRLGPYRPATVVQADIDSLLRTPGIDDCRVINGPITREACPKVDQLKRELLASKEAARLEADLVADREALSDLPSLGIAADPQIYDPAKDAWSRGAPFPHGVHHAASAGLGGKLYVLGGYVNGWTPSAEACVYDPATDQWQRLPDLPTPRGSPAAAVIDSKIHVVGGVGPNRLNSGAHEVFNPATAQWESLPPLPTPRDHLALTSLDGRLYAFGGRLNGDYSRNLATLEIYDSAKQSWTAGPAMPTARSGIASAAVAGLIYVVGGEGPSGTFAEVEVYDPAAGSWSRRARMPTPRHGLVATAVSGRIYVVAGGPRPGASYSNLNESFTP
jgi:N-acetylneuraminic acid mutarotase